MLATTPTRRSQLVRGKTVGQWRRPGPP